MKRSAWLCIPLALALLLPAVGCKKKGGRALDVLPSGAKVLFSLDFARFAKLDLFDQMVGKPSDGDAKPGAFPFKDYTDFVAKTGVDPKKDVFAIAGGVYGELQGENPDLVISVAWRADRGRVLAELRKGKEKLKEETVGAAVVLTPADPAQQGWSMAFVGNDLLLLGSAGRVRESIGLATGKGGGVLNDARFKKPLAKLDRGSLFWLILGELPAGLKSGAQQGSPFPVNLEKAEAFFMSADFRDAKLSADLQLLLADEKSSAQIATTLNGIKGLGAAAAAQDPDAGQLLNSLQITSSADGVRISLAIPEALLKKMAEKAKEKALEAGARPGQEPSVEPPPETEGDLSDEPQEEPAADEATATDWEGPPARP